MSTLSIIRGVTNEADSYFTARPACDLAHILRVLPERDESPTYPDNTPVATENLVSAGFSPAGGGYIGIREG